MTFAKILCQIWSVCFLIKTYMSNLVSTARFLNNIHQSSSKSKVWKETRDRFSQNNQLAVNFTFSSLLYLSFYFLFIYFFLFIIVEHDLFLNLY